MPTADAHLHLFADGYSGVSGASPAGGDETAVYERLRRYHGIEHSLVLGYEAVADGVSADDVVDEVLKAAPEPSTGLRGAP